MSDAHHRTQARLPGRIAPLSWPHVLAGVVVGGAKYGPLAVVSHDPGFGPGRGDGLLGRDFLDHFTINIDNAAGLLTLTPR